MNVKLKEKFDILHSISDDISKKKVLYTINKEEGTLKTNSDIKKMIDERDNVINKIVDQIKEDTIKSHASTWCNTQKLLQDKDKEIEDLDYDLSVIRSENVKLSSKNRKLSEGMSRCTDALKNMFTDEKTEHLITQLKILMGAQELSNHELFISLVSHVYAQIDKMVPIVKKTYSVDKTKVSPATKVKGGK